MKNALNSSRGLAILLAAAALVMALVRGGAEGPFAEMLHDGTLEMRLDINRAAMHEVESLPGVGPVLAGRIVHYRAVHGPFRHKADLDAVKGIGAVLITSLEPYIKTGGTKDSVGALDDEVGGGKEGRVDR